MRAKAGGCVCYRRDDQGLGRGSRPVVNFPGNLARLCELAESADRPALPLLSRIRMGIRPTRGHPRHVLLTETTLSPAKPTMTEAGTDRALRNVNRQKTMANRQASPPTSFGPSLHARQCLGMGRRLLAHTSQRRRHRRTAQLGSRTISRATWGVGGFVEDSQVRFVSSDRHRGLQG